jgi:hypothetical protein
MKRDPLIDPQPGDVLRCAVGRCEVVSVEPKIVFLLTNPADRSVLDRIPITWHSTLAWWRKSMKRAAVERAA